MNRKQRRAETKPSGRGTQPALPGVTETFAAALRSHQTGRLGEAEILCRQVLAADPRHAGSLFLLGVMAGQAGRPERAAVLFGKAIAIEPAVAAFHYNLGNALQEQGRLDAAIASHRSAIELRPDFAEAHSNLGAALAEQGELDEAIACQRRAIALRPDFPEAHNNLGTALQEQGGLEEAAACFARAIAIREDFPEAHNNLGNALERQNRLGEAVGCYRWAIALNPNYPRAYINLGVALQKLGGLEEAVDCCRRAIALRPDDPEAHARLGSALHELKRLDEAVACYRRAIALRPDDAAAHGSLGDVLAEQGRLDEALASYDKAMTLKPDLAFLQSQRLHTKMRICDWRDIPSQIENLTLGIRDEGRLSSPFFALSLEDSPSMHRKCAESFVRVASQGQGTLPAILKYPRHDKIRLGYFSADYYNDATSHFMAALFERHDRGKFDVVGFSFGPDRQDTIRDKVAASFDRFIDVGGLPDRDVAVLARNLEIDIAIDLKGFTTDFRLNIFAHRAAPLQVSYLGYPGTMAADYIDYLIADSVVIPDGSQQHYSENIVYLPHSYQVNDRTRVIAEKVFTRQELGLPESGFVYCCFNNNRKITPATFAGWMRILHQVEGSVLWLLADNPWSERNLRREAAARGVAPERLVFAARLPVAEHLARQRAADLFLDTLPYNAHTTASDALWAGLPVLTRAGASFAGRVAASLLSAIGLAELITTNAADYERRAVDLARDPAELSRIRAVLARNRLSTPLFDTGLFTRHIEAAYSQMYERYQAGLAPAPIRVSP